MDVEAFVNKYTSYTSDVLRARVLVEARQQLTEEQFAQFTTQLGLTPEAVERAANLAFEERQGPRQTTTSTTSTTSADPDLGLRPGDPFPDFDVWQESFPEGTMSDWLVAKQQYEAAGGGATGAAGAQTREQTAASLEVGGNVGAAEQVRAEQRQQQTIDQRPVEQRQVDAAIDASRRSAREAERRRTLTPEEARQELYATLKSVEILRQLGIETGELTTSILEFYKGRPQTLPEVVAQFRDEGVSDSDIAVFLTQQPTGSPIQVTRVEPMLNTLEYRNVWVPELNKFVWSNMPGLVDANGYLLMGEDGKPVNSYDVSQANVVLEDLPDEVRWATLDRLETLGILTNWSTAGQEAAFLELLMTANEKGRQWNVVLDMMDAEQGVSNGRDQRAMRPSRFAEGSPMGDAIQEVALSVLGRGLTEAEKRSIYAEYKMMESKYPLYVRSARAGAPVPTETGEVMSIDTITENWLEQNKPEEVKRARQMPAWEMLYEAAMDGAFNERPTSE